MPQGFNFSLMTYHFSLLPKKSFRNITILALPNIYPFSGLRDESFFNFNIALLQCVCALVGYLDFSSRAVLFRVALFCRSQRMEFVAWHNCFDRNNLRDNCLCFLSIRRRCDNFNNYWSNCFFNFALSAFYFASKGA